MSVKKRTHLRVYKKIYLKKCWQKKQYLLWVHKTEINIQETCVARFKLQGQITDKININQMRAHPRVLKEKN